MEKIFVFAGPLDIYSIVNVPMHSSPKIVLDELLRELEDDFGKGVRLNRVSSTRYDVNVDDVLVGAVA